MEKDRWNRRKGRWRREQKRRECVKIRRRRV
jgi:hypothetical protein